MRASTPALSNCRIGSPLPIKTTPPVVRARFEVPRHETKRFDPRFHSRIKRYISSSRTFMNIWFLRLFYNIISQTDDFGKSFTRKIRTDAIHYAIDEQSLVIRIDELSVLIGV